MCSSEDSGPHEDTAGRQPRRQQEGFGAEPLKADSQR